MSDEPPQTPRGFFLFFFFFFFLRPMTASVLGAAQTPANIRTEPAPWPTFLLTGDGSNDVRNIWYQSFNSKEGAGPISRPRAITLNL